MEEADATTAAVQRRIARAALLSTGEMGRADSLTIAAGTSGLQLMERAGKAVLERLTKDHRAGALLVLAGPGNNGGDGFVVARLAKEAGWDVRVGILGSVNDLKGDASDMASRWRGATRPASPHLLEGADVVIDALFGAGLNRPVTGPAAELINAVNASGKPVIAVDVPSGIQGNTGARAGTAIKADATVTFFRAKPGHYLMPGCVHRGALTVADIGIKPEVLGEILPSVFHNTPDLWAHDFPKVEPSTYKTRRGHTMVVSGGPLNTGAARLAADGALRSGAGLVTVLAAPEAALVNAQQLTAVMVQAFDNPDALMALVRNRADALVIGPAAGINERTRAHVLALLEARIPIVLDADVFSVFASDRASLKSRLHEQVVFTPHPGEFERFFPAIAERIPCRLEAAREAALDMGATVLLKGPDTVIASPRGEDAAISTHGSPHLATAGSGDVLAGIIAGLLAQGMEPFLAASAGAWLHGDAAIRLGRGLISEDLPRALPTVLQALEQDYLKVDE